MTSPSLMSALPQSETIAWSAPAPRGLILRARDAIMIPFSLIWTGFVATFFIGAANQDGFARMGVGFLIPCCMLAFGLYLVFGRFIFEMIVRAKTTYVVTDRAAYIVQPGFGGGTKRFGAATSGDATLIRRAYGFGTIRFGPAAPVFGRSSSYQPQATSFERIPDAQHVYDLVIALGATYGDR